MMTDMIIISILVFILTLALKLVMTTTDIRREEVERNRAIALYEADVARQKRLIKKYQRERAAMVTYQKEQEKACTPNALPSSPTTSNSGGTSLPKCL